MATNIEASTVISALQILVTPRQGSKTEIGTGFTDILLDNISVFEKTIESEERFQQFAVIWQAENTVSIKSEDKSTWKFVAYCLKCLHLLQQMLSECIKEYNHVNQVQNKKSNTPTMCPDTLNFNEQKLVKTAVQFIVCLGVCPRLQTGVGIPIQLRSGFSNLLQMSKNEKTLSPVEVNHQLFTCVKILMSCIQIPVLGTIILTEHLTDILAVLFQLCHENREHKVETKTESSEDNVIASFKHKISIENSNPAEIVDVVRSKFNDKHTEEILNTSSVTDANTPDSNNSEIVLENGSLDREDGGDTMIDIKFCTEKLNELMKRVYLPLLVRTLMLLQGGPVNKKTKTIPGIQPAPKWLKQECSYYLVSIIIKPKGVLSVLRGMMDVPGAGKGMTDAYDWRKSDAVAKVITCCPLQSVSTEVFYKAVGSQIIDILHIEDIKVCKQFLPAVCCMICNMMSRHEQFTLTYVIHSILGPLLSCAENRVVNVTDDDHTIVSESHLTRCIDDCQKVFITGCSINPRLITYIQPVYLILFDLYVFTSQGVSVLRSKCQEILTTFLKQLDCEEVMNCLECITFKQVCKDSKYLMKHENIKFVHGDNGSAMVVTDCTESDTQSFDDSHLNCIVTILESLQTTDVPGQFLVYLLKELTKFIQSEIKGDNLEDVTQASGDSDEKQALIDIELRYQSAVSKFNRKLILLNLLASLCEKLGPSCIKNAQHTVDFIKVTLERCIQVCKSTDDDELEVFENETVSMAIGLITALMTGAFEMTDKDWKYIQELLPLLEELSQCHPDPSIREMSTDMRIAIATHGVVWSEMTKGKSPPSHTGAKKINTGTYKKSNKDSKKIVELSSSDVAEQKVKVNVKSVDKVETANTHDTDAKCNVNVVTSDDKLNKVGKKSEDDACVYKKDEKSSSGLNKEVADKDENTSDGLVKEREVHVSKEAINDDNKAADYEKDGFITNDDKELTELDMAFKELCDPLIPVRGHGLIRLYHLVEKQDVSIENKHEVLLKIFEENLDHGDSYIYLSAIKGLTALCDKHAALVIPRVCDKFANFGQGNHGNVSPELRMKLGEVMIKASRCLGDLLPSYRDILLPSILCGVKDNEAFVRASSLSNLGEICKLLKFSLGNIIHEVFECCCRTLKHDTDVEVRKSAAQALTLMLQGLGSNIFKVLESVLKDMYKLMKSVMITEKDDGVKLHVQLALNELDDLMRQYLFPQQKLEKKIRVLDFD
ncbi:Transport and Golgi organization protein 6 [Mactra antiquata]